MSLVLSDTLTLPDEAVTQTFAILAKRGVGKTYTASVMVEEMLKAQLQVVVVDPIGVWFGLRSSADGKAPGMSIIVAGGEHGDLPIDAASGTIIADLIVEHRLSMVIDLSLLRKGEQKRFMIDFAETLYHRNRTAMHLVLDEADEFAPQRPMGDDARMLGAIEDLVRRGRARGIGITMITQRPAVLNKNVLTQIEVLVAMRLTSPQDRTAIAEWIKYHADDGQAQEMLQSLGSLPIGTAWFCSPGWLDLFKKVAIRKRVTFDSSSTPEVGAVVVQQGTMATVDIERLKEQLAATIEKAKADDPKMLRAKVAQLERELADRKPLVEVREVPVISSLIVAQLEELIGPLAERLTELTELLQATNTSAAREPKITMTNIYKPGIDPNKPIGEIRRHEGEIQVTATDAAKDLADGLNLAKAERLILTTLAQFPNGRTKKQIALMTGYSHKGGGFQNALSALRVKGFIAGQNELQITAVGKVAIGSNYEPLPADLVKWWMAHLPLAPRKILEVIAFKYPKRLSKIRVAEMAGYQPTGGGFQNALSRLRTLGLIEGSSEIKASDDLF